MLRKTILAGAAALTLGAAALAPTSASAWWSGNPGWHGWHHGWFCRPAVRVYAGPIYGGCLHRAWCGRRMVPRSAGLMSATDDALPRILERPAPSRGVFL